MRAFGLFVLALFFPGAGFARQRAWSNAALAWLASDLPLAGMLPLVALVPRHTVTIVYAAFGLWLVARLVQAVWSARGSAQPPAPAALVAVWVFTTWGVTTTIAGVTRALTAEPFACKSPGMEPTLLEGDQFFTVKSGPAATPGRGDVVVFEQRPGVAYPKRIVGLGGDTVRVVDGAVFVNGSAIARGPCDEATAGCVVESLDGRTWRTQQTGLRAERGEWAVPAGMMFVVGDNRDHSLDSRHWGPVPASSVKGVATAIWLSPQHPDRIGTRLLPALRAETPKPAGKLENSR